MLNGLMLLLFLLSESLDSKADVSDGFIFTSFVVKFVFSCVFSYIWNTDERLGFPYS